MKLRQALAGICFSAYFVAACAAPSDDTAGTKENDVRKPQTTEERRELRQQLAERDAKKLDALERARTEEADPPRGEIPDEILDKLLNDLASKTDATRTDIEVIRAESLTWSDGSLGCGKPGEFYTQALVPGYHVIFGYKGQQFDYRATEKGYFMLCEQPVLARPGAGKNPPVQ